MYSIFKLIVYIKPVLGEDEFLTNGNLTVEKQGNVLKITNLFREENFKSRIMFVSSNLTINSFTGEKENFFGIVITWLGVVLTPDFLIKCNTVKEENWRNECFFE